MAEWGNALRLMPWRCYLVVIGIVGSHRAERFKQTTTLPKDIPFKCYYSSDRYRVFSLL